MMKKTTITDRLEQLATNHKIVYSILFLLSVCTLFLFSYSSSPLYLYKNYGGDGSFFAVIGDAVLSGRTPYTELFDHKGPVLFYLQALAQILIPGKIGIFLTQIVNLFLILLLLYRTTLIFTRSALHVSFTLCSFLLLFILTIHNGNQTEEYSLLHAMIAVYLTIRFYFTDNRQIAWWKVVIMGLCFSLSFWMRPNNAGMVAACFAFIFLVLLMDKQWMRLWETMLTFFATIVLFSLLVAAYFYSIDALEEMLYATFIFNFKYMGGGIIELPFGTIFLFCSVLFVIIVPFLAGCYLLFHRRKDRNILFFGLLILFFGVLPMCSIRMFDHYLTVPIPAFSVGMMFFFAAGYYQKTFSRVGVPAFLVIAMFALIPNVKNARWSLSITDDYHQVVNEIKSNIPPSEYDQVYAYDLVPAFYMISDIKPTINTF